MVKSINKKMLLMVSSLVSGMVVAGEKTAHPCELLPQHFAAAIVAKQFCDTPGQHVPLVLNDHAKYDLMVTQPMDWPMAGATISSVLVFFKGKQKMESASPFTPPIHSVQWDKVHGGDVLWVTFCDGKNGMLEIGSNKIAAK